MASVLFQRLGHIFPVPFCFKCFYWIIRCYSDLSAFISDLIFLFCSFQYSFFSLCLNVVTLTSHGEFLFWSYLFRVLQASVLAWASLSASLRKLLVRSYCKYSVCLQYSVLFLFVPRMKHLFMVFQSSLTFSSYPSLNSLLTFTA